MARQVGILPIEGTIDNLNFFKSGDGYLVRKKGGVSGDKIATEPDFARTRENMSEFGRAGRAGKVLRNALRNTIMHAKDARMVSRLTREMVKVLREDKVNVRGQRNVIDGEAALLMGFEFNLYGKLGTTVFAPYTPTLDRVNGAASLDVPSFIPANMITAPQGTTHFRLFIGAASIDFETPAYESGMAESADLAYDGAATTALQLDVSLSANSAHPLFLAFGIVFLQEVNGARYPLKNGAFNACSLVLVNTPA